MQEAVYVVTLKWSRPQPGLHRLRADAVALIGTVAEGSTFVQQRVIDREIEYHVTTGMLEGDSPLLRTATCSSSVLVARRSSRSSTP